MAGMAAADAHKLLARLPPDTAASVLEWLTGRGKDLPVHIPAASIRFSRECFTLIDTDGSGSLEPGELLAVFTVSRADYQGLFQPLALQRCSRPSLLLPPQCRIPSVLPSPAGPGPAGVAAPGQRAGGERGGRRRYLAFLLRFCAGGLVGGGWWDAGAAGSQETVVVRRKAMVV